MNPDLVRIVTVCRASQQNFEGAVGVLTHDTGHGLYTVHVPSHDVDVQCREVTVIAKAQPVQP